MSEDSALVALVPALRAFARSLERSDPDADDLVQETLLKAIAHRHQFTPGTSLKSWLFTIMRNTFYTARRKQHREGPAAYDGVELSLGTGSTQEWTIRGREVRNALHKLPERQRELVTLVCILGVSYEEAAEVMGCKIGTVKSGINRARANLVSMLGERNTLSAVHYPQWQPSSASQV